MAEKLLTFAEAEIVVKKIQLKYGCSEMDFIIDIHHEMMPEYRSYVDIIGKPIFHIRALDTVMEEYDIPTEFDGVKIEVFRDPYKLPSLYAGLSGDLGSITTLLQARDKLHAMSSQDMQDKYPDIKYDNGRKK